MQAVAQASGGGRKRSRMQASLPLLLELLAILLLVLAAAGPRVLAAGRRVPVVLVFDDSFSMAAGRDGSSARDRGLAAAAAEIEALGRYSVAFVVAGPEPTRLAASARSAAELQEAAEAWRPAAVSSDLDAAVALARETGGPDARVVVVTDHPRTADATGPEAAQSAAPGSPGGIRWLAVGEATDNAAVVLAVRSAEGAAADTLLAEVTRVGPDPAAPARPVRVAVEAEVPGAGPLAPPAGWTELRASPVDLRPGQTERFRVDLPASAAERAVRVRVSMPGDPLGADDAAVLAPGRRPAVAAASAVTDPRLARAAEAALAAAGTRRVAPSEAELLVADRPVPGRPGLWRLSLEAPTAGVAAESFLGPFLVDEASPLADGWSLAGLVWTAATDANAPGRPLALAGSTPLVSIDGDPSADAPVGGAVTAHVNLDAARSTVLASPAWPVLVDNLARARRAARAGVAPANAPPGLALRLRSGPAPETVEGEAPAPPVATVTRLTDAGGSAAEAQPAAVPLPGGVAAVSPEAAGLHRADLPDGTTARFAVVATSATESDLSAAATAASGELIPDAAEAPGYRDLAWALGLLALGVLGLEAWLVYGRQASSSSAEASPA